MTQTNLLAISMFVLAVATSAAGCKKQPEGTAAGAGSPAPTETKPAAPVAADPPAAAKPPAAPPAPAAGPYALPADARVVTEHDARKADASSLGADVTLHLVDKVGDNDPGDPSRHVDQVVALTGTGAVIVEIGFVRDQDPAYQDHMVRPIAPLSPPRAFQKADASVPLKFAGPLLYLKHWKGGNVAVAHDGDAIVVWRSEILQGEGEDGQAQDWFVQAKIQLAPGAKVTAL